MKCIHHNDDDGLCAAAIVRFYLKDKPEEPSDFIMWKHGQELVLPEKLNEGETWYIVDLQMNRRKQSKMLHGFMRLNLLVVCSHSFMLRWIMN